MSKQQDFGSVTFEDNVYTLTDAANFSNRPFVGWFGDALLGEEYTTEFSASALDPSGNEYRVYWQFDTVKGAEREIDRYPWGDEHITRVVSE